jgi:hypothetical protein
VATALELLRCLVSHVEAKSIEHNCTVNIQKGSTMKAAATALVLVVGAVVVLWLGDSLNSWVLGGLIGGLAALLLSIPISLVLFSYLSRRHDEQLHAVAQEEVKLAQVHEYQAPVVVEPEGYTVDASLPLLEEMLVDQRVVSRRLPTHTLSEQTAISFERQHQISNKLPVARRGTYLPAVARQQRAVAPTKGVRTARRLSYPGFPGYQPGSVRSQLQAAALRTARLEAAQQYDDIDILPPNVSRQRVSMQYDQSMHEEQEREHMCAVQKQTKQAQQTQQTVYRTNQLRSRRIVDAPPSRGDSSRALLAGAESSPQHQRQSEPRTDHLRDYPQTGPVRQSSHYPPRQTGQIARHPHLDGAQHNSAEAEGTTGPMRHTLLRRAPYLYEDDPLRQQFAQQIDMIPLRRRSSRRDDHSSEEEE